MLTRFTLLLVGLVFGFLLSETSGAEAYAGYCEDNVCHTSLWYCVYYDGSDDFRFNCSMEGPPGGEDACKTTLCDEPD